MSYKKMEAILVEKVHRLREMEQELMRSYIQLKWNPSNATTAAVNQGFEEVDQQLRLIERLMADMDRVDPTGDLGFVAGLDKVVSTPAYQV